VPKPTSIEAAVAAAGAKLDGVRVFDVRHRGITPDPDCDSLFIGIGNAGATAGLKGILGAHYPPGHAVTAVSRPGMRDQQARALMIATLEQAGELAAPVSVFVPAPAPEQRPTVTGLRGVMARLRGENGCPWDREQDHRTLRRCLLEEAHETLDAIDREDWQELAVELGDILLQVLFHAQLAAERGDFDFDDVTARLREKLVARHPHVFGDAVAHDAEAVLRRWEELKRDERREAGEEHPGDLRAGAARTLPALDRAQKVQRGATHVGFDWPNIEGPLAKLAEEIEELQALLARERPGSARLEHEMGDILFSAVNVSRFAGVDAEQALRMAVDRFAQRFAIMEKLAAEQGQALAEMDLEQMDSLWERAKLEVGNRK
jgi:tetrapyrrole methylase family protein/MazG family protein